MTRSPEERVSSLGQQGHHTIPTRAPASSSLRYRADVDGLRAVAVYLVFFYHLEWSSVPHGFLGVDVFFVISGFLITGVVRTEIEASRKHFLEDEQQLAKQQSPVSTSSTRISRSTGRQEVLVLQEKRTTTSQQGERHTTMTTSSVSTTPTRTPPAAGTRTAPVPRHDPRPPSFKLLALRTLRRFYLRRIRRLLPALILVLSTTFLFALFTLLPKDVVDYALLPGLMALCSASNLYFHSVRSDYWSPDTAQQPLLHTWSLAVEEQFYLVWPVVLLSVDWAVGVGFRRSYFGSRNVVCCGFDDGGDHLLPVRRGEETGLTGDGENMIAVDAEEAHDRSELNNTSIRDVDGEGHRRNTSVSDVNGEDVLCATATTSSAKQVVEKKKSSTGVLSSRRREELRASRALLTIGGSMVVGVTYVLLLRTGGELRDNYWSGWMRHNYWLPHWRAWELLAGCVVSVVLVDVVGEKNVLDATEELRGKTKTSICRERIVREVGAFVGLFFILHAALANEGFFPLEERGASEGELRAWKIGESVFGAATFIAAGTMISSSSSRRHDELFGAPPPRDSSPPHAAHSSPSRHDPIKLSRYLYFRNFFLDSATDNPAQPTTCRLLGNRLFVAAGLRSYSLYLWHWPLIAFSQYQSVAVWNAVPSFLLFVVAHVLAYLSYTWVEQPFRKRKFVLSDFVSCEISGQCGIIGGKFFRRFFVDELCAAITLFLVLPIVVFSGLLFSFGFLPPQKRGFNALLPSTPEFNHWGVDIFSGFATRECRVHPVLGDIFGLLDPGTGRCRTTVGAMPPSTAVAPVLILGDSHLATPFWDALLRNANLTGDLRGISHMEWFRPGVVPARIRFELSSSSASSTTTSSSGSSGGSAGTTTGTPAPASTRHPPRRPRRFVVLNSYWTGAVREWGQTTALSSTFYRGMKKLGGEFGGSEGRSSAEEVVEDVRALNRATVSQKHMENLERDLGVVIEAILQYGATPILVGDNAVRAGTVTASCGLTELSWRSREQCRTSFLSYLALMEPWVAVFLSLKQRFGQSLVLWPSPVHGVCRLVKDDIQNSSNAAVVVRDHAFLGRAWATSVVSSLNSTGTSTTAPNNATGARSASDRGPMMSEARETLRRRGGPRCFSFVEVAGIGSPRERAGLGRGQGTISEAGDRGDHASSEASPKRIPVFGDFHHYTAELWRYLAAAHLQDFGGNFFVNQTKNDLDYVPEDLVVAHYL